MGHDWPNIYFFPPFFLSENTSSPPRAPKEAPATSLAPSVARKPRGFSGRNKKKSSRRRWKLVDLLSFPPKKRKNMRTFHQIDWVKIFPLGDSELKIPPKGFKAPPPRFMRFWAHVTCHSTSFCRGENSVISETYVNFRPFIGTMSKSFTWCLGRLRFFFPADVRKYEQWHLVPHVHPATIKTLMTLL